MNPRENVMAVLEQQEPEWIPWIPLIGDANTPCFVPDELKKDGDILKLAFYLKEELNCDLLLGTGIIKTKFNSADYTRKIDNDLIIEKYSIKGRTLKKVTRRMEAEGQISHAIKEFPVKDADDLKTLEMIIEDSYLEYDIEEYNRLNTGIGDQGLVTVMGPRTPVMDLIITRMGGENFTYTFFDYPEAIERIIDKMDQLNQQIYRKIAEADLDFKVVEVHEDQDTMLLSPGMYKKYIQPLMKNYCGIIHQGNKLFMMHACGHVNGYLKMIYETGIDAHHYLTDSPVGDTSAAEARRVLNNEITVMAAVDPFIQADGSVEDVKKNVFDILKQVQPGDNFILMSPLKPDIPEENIRIIGRIMQEYGQYPIEFN